MSFIKMGPVSSAEMFAAEAEGLIELAKPGVIRVPNVIDYGIRGNEAFIEIEQLNLQRANREIEKRMGVQLAELSWKSIEDGAWVEVPG